LCFFVKLKKVHLFYVLKELVSDKTSTYSKKKVQKTRNIVGLLD